MENVKSFNDFLGEGRGNASMYKSVVQDALKLLGYNLKQSEFKVTVKRESLYDLILLNGYSLCSSSDYAQMLTWIQNAIKEDPAAYGLDPEVLESTSKENVDEAMVQVAGKGKPAGAMVLSKVILGFLKDGGYLTPAAERQGIALEGDIAQLIMDSTF